MGDATQGPMDSLHFFFSFELSYQGEPRSPSGRGLGVFDGQFSQKLLQSLPSLCRMVVRRLE
jgi:hypothetical protein